jgi:preprotein translocase subunit SecA
LSILNKDDLAAFIAAATTGYWDLAFGEAISERTDDVKRLFDESGIAKGAAAADIDFTDSTACRKIIEEKSAHAAENPMAKNQLVSVLDMLWMNNLEDLDALSESVGLRAYGQRDPLVEYRHEASAFYKDFWNNFNAIVFMNVFKLASNQPSAQANPQQPAQSNQFAKAGRNDPCPCGSGKKYKKCHGA